jgi:hypothetical protein
MEPGDRLGERAFVTLVARLDPRCTKRQMDARIFRRTVWMDLLVPHLEPVEAFKRGFVDLHILHARAGRAFPNAVDELLDTRFGTFDMRLDRTVGRIADPAADSEPLRFVSRPSAEEDALDVADDANSARDSVHHTVEISGASSAFIPTTL